jgi:diaminobutyrate-2-oxoglutarate transaminase
MAAGAASIDFMIDNNLSDHAKVIGDYMLTRFKKLEQTSSIVGEVRGKGLMLGIELVEDKETKVPSETLADAVRTECYQNGVLIEIGGHYNNVARFLPPLIITKELAETGAVIVEEAIEKVENPLTN